MILVRPATRDDIGAVDALLGRSYGPLLRGDYPPSTLVLALPAMARAQPRLIASGRYFVAEEEGERLLGAGGWSEDPPGRGAAVAGIGHVRHVATDARAARRGVGRAVMARVMEDAGAAGVRRLDCLSTLTAVPFYRALGFREVGAVTLQFNGAPFAAMALERDL